MSKHIDRFYSFLYDLDEIHSDLQTQGIKYNPMYFDGVIDECKNDSDIESALYDIEDYTSYLESLLGVGDGGTVIRPTEPKKVKKVKKVKTTNNERSIMGKSNNREYEFNHLTDSIIELEDRISKTNPKADFKIFNDINIDKASDSEYDKYLADLQSYETKLKTAEINTTIKEDKKNRSTASEKFNASLEELKAKASEKDELAKHTSSKKGSREYGFWSKLHKNIQGINSVSKLLDSVRWLKLIGWVAVLPVTIIHFIGIMYDIDYHVPTISDDVGVVWIGLFSVFMTFVLMAFTHVLSHNLINSQLKPTVKRTFLILFIIGMTLNFYFSWRAIKNYTVGVVEGRKTEMLTGGTTTNSIMASTFANQIQQGIQRVNTINTKIQNNNTRLSQIPHEISLMASKKIKSGERMRKLTSVVSKRKETKIAGGIQSEIDRLLNEKKALEADNSKLQNTLDSLQSQAISLANQQKGELGALDNHMSKEQFDREVFLFLLVFFTELASMSGVIAMFIQDKNIDPDHHDKVHEIRVTASSEEVLNQAYADIQIDQINRIAEDSDRNRIITNTISHAGAVSSEANINVLNTITRTTNDTIEATAEIAEQAVKGLTAQMQIGGANKMIGGLTEVIGLQSENMTKLDKQIIELKKQVREA